VDGTKHVGVSLYSINVITSHRVIWSSRAL